MSFGRGDYYIGRRRRRGGILPVFMSVAALAIGVVSFLLLRPSLSGVVVDAYSGQPIPGVQLTLGDQRGGTDRQGRFTLLPVTQPATLALQPPAGHAAAQQEVAPGRAKGLTFSLRPTTLSGVILRKDSDTPLANIVVQAIGDGGAVSSQAMTGDDGRYVLADVPPGARLIVEGPGFARKELEIGRRSALDLELRPDILTGVVRTKEGKPLPKATVAMAGVSATTGPNGAYTLTGIPDDSRIVVKASGYTQQEQTLGDALKVDFALEPLVVKGIYLTPDSIIRDEKFNALLALADRTEINAMVLDFKDETGWLYHDSKNALARAIGAVHPAYDIQKRLATLREHNIYTIARIVCMQDDTLGRKRPEMAVRDSTTGGVWENDNGVAWVNAMRPDVWGYNIEIAVEAARLGFSEIQYDYVRFPSDGDLDAIDVGTPYTRAARTDAIYNFLKSTQEALAPYGVPLAVDIFGIALWDPHDNGIGQQLEKLAPVVDYINPMIYPSHFFKGSMGFDVPNDHPYEVILQSLQAGGERIENPQLKLRPWLQDFSYGRGIAYGPNEVKAQMQATYDFGATGWMLWNANNTFTEAALAPQGR